MNVGGGSPRRGERLHGTDGVRIGVIDAVFADYLLVRTAGLLPVDLYVPIPEVRRDEQGRLRVLAGRTEAYERWHRPLRSAPHQ